MKIVRNLSFIVVTSLLLACAEVPKNAPAYERVAVADKHKSNVYIYRINANPTKRTPMIKIDDKPIFEAPDGSYSVIELAGGTHHVSIEWPWDVGGDTKFPIRVQKGVPLYIKISGTQFAQVLTQAEAEDEVKKCCRFISPKSYQ